MQALDYEAGLQFLKSKADITICFHCGNGKTYCKYSFAELFFPSTVGHTLGRSTIWNHMISFMKPPSCTMFLLLTPTYIQVHKQCIDEANLDFCSLNCGRILDWICWLPKLPVRLLYQNSCKIFPSTLWFWHIQNHGKLSFKKTLVWVPGENILQGCRWLDMISLIVSFYLWGIIYDCWKAN